MVERQTVVETAAGGLKAVLAVPDGEVRAGLVLVDGSGPATRDAWQGLPGWLAERGVATLRHDKPGCGGSPGDWREQTFADRAAEALAAVAALRERTGVERVGLIGYSQGGWISLAAAAGAPEAVDFVVTVSGPMVGIAEQERVSIERTMRRAGLPAGVIDAGLRWVDERAARLAVGDSPAQVFAEQAGHANRGWYQAVAAAPYDTVETLAFFARTLAFDPARLIPHLRCPIMAFFGAADEQVPVERSVAVLAARLPGLHRGLNGIAVLPGVGHMLYALPPRGDVPLFEQLSPGFLPLLGDFLGRVVP